MAIARPKQVNVRLTKDEHAAWVAYTKAKYGAKSDLSHAIREAMAVAIAIAIGEHRS